MDTLKAITFIACFLGIAISMLDIITPSDKLKKQIRFIFSLVFIIAITSSILNSEIDFEIPSSKDIEQSEQYQAVMKTYTQNLADNFKTNIENNLKEKLKINNIEAKNVSLNVDVDENECISIKGADVVLAKTDKNISSKVKTVIQNEIGSTQVNITYTEENDEQSN